MTDGLDPPDCWYPRRVSGKTIDVRALHCPQCGAPAQVQPGLDAYRCNFCGGSFLVERPMQQAPMPPPPPIQLPPARFDAPAMRHVVISPPSSGFPLASFIVLLAVGAGVVGAVLAFRTVGGRGGGGGGGGVFGGPASWDGKTPLTCSGNQSIIVDHVTTADLGKGPAIDASGNCSVYLKDCHVQAQTVVRASENATVSFDHGSAEGATFDVVTEFASVSANHTRVTGAKKEPEKSYDVSYDPERHDKPILCGGGSSKEIKGARIKVASGAAVIASINCHLKLVDCHLEGPVGILLNDNADIELDHCAITAGDGLFARANGNLTIEGGSFVATGIAFDLDDNASVDAHGAKIEGSRSARGNGTIRVDE